MRDIKRAVREISEEFDGGGLPQGFTEKYDQLECLAHSHGTETFLARNRATEKLYVAKLTRGSTDDPDRESGILRALDHEGLPSFADEFRSGDSVCVVREYIDGTPLDRYAAENRLTPRQAADICLRLCDILIYLHGQDPPVIHRDIKPQNIIVRPDGGVALIDFDISRFYSDGAGTDTQFFGTREYAPPEQYGFTQTDCRTDIYAVGVVLKYLMTGSERGVGMEIVPASYRRVTERCTAFAPKDRYPSAEALKRALVTAERTENRTVSPYGVAAAVLCALCVGFAAGRYTDILPALSTEPPALSTEVESVSTEAPKAQTVSFTEPLIESAVRVQLGKPEGESITEEELLSVREIYIFGTETAKTGETFQRGLGVENADSLIRGNIRTLDDLLLLPNLEICHVGYQTLSDISALAEAKLLREADLKHTSVEDVSALAGNLSLEALNLYGTNVSDTRCLDSCPRLHDLDLGGTLTPSPEEVGGAATLTSLSLKRLTWDTLNGLERFESLRQLSLEGAQIGDYSAIAGMEKLEELRVSGDGSALASPAAQEADIHLVVSE